MCTGFEIGLLGTSLASLGYGIYAGDKAAKSQQRQHDQDRQDALNQQAQQAAMLKQQNDAATALAAQQAQEQKDAQAAQQKMQQDALASAQGQIPVIQGQLGQSLQNSENLSLSQTNPILEARLNAMGLLQSGALPEAQAKYQAQLDQQRQSELANYGINANTAIQNQALNYAGTDAGYLQQNLNTTLSNQQQALMNQDQSAQQAFANNVAMNQYLGNMGSKQNQMAADQANQFIDLSGQLAGAGMYMYGQNRKPQSVSSTFTDPNNPNSPTYQQTPITQSYSNPSLGALQYSRKAGILPY